MATRTPEAADRPGGVGSPPAPGLRADLERLGEELDHGTERLAAERRVEHGAALADLVRRTFDSPPQVFVERARRWGPPDVVVVVALVVCLGLAVRAGFVLAGLEPPAETVARVTLGRGAPETRGEALFGRSLLTLPIEPASYALLGDLPTRVSAAVVPDSIPDDGPARPISFFDDLLVLEAEASEGEVAVLVAVVPGEVPALLAALPDATVRLLRRPGPATTVSRTSSASPRGPSG